MPFYICKKFKRNIAFAISNPCLFKITKENLPCYYLFMKYLHPQTSIQSNHYIFKSTFYEEVVGLIA